MSKTDQPVMATGDPPNMLDRGSFAALYRTIYPRLALVAVGIIGDRSHAEDIVQEAAIIALRKIDDFTPGSSFAAWMSEIVRRCALNYVRKRTNRATFATDPRTLDHSANQADEQSAARTVSDRGRLIEDQSEFDDEVVRALGAISEEARCCLLLRTVLDLPYAEISEMLAIPQGTAMSHVHRSKQAMRKRLCEPMRGD